MGGGGGPFCFFICSFIYLFTCLFISFFIYLFFSLFIFYLFVLSFCLSFHFFSIFLVPASKLFRVTWVNKLHRHFIFYMVCNGKTKQHRQIRCSGVPGFSTCQLSLQYCSSSWNNVVFTCTWDNMGFVKILNCWARSCCSWEE